MRIVSLIFHHFYTWFLFLLCILAFCAWGNVQCFSRRNHERRKNLIENHSTFMVATFNHSRSFSDQSKKIKTRKNVSSHNTPNTTAILSYISFISNKMPIISLFQNIFHSSQCFLDKSNSFQKN